MLTYVLLCPPCRAYLRKLTRPQRAVRTVALVLCTQVITVVEFVTDICDIRQAGFDGDIPRFYLLQSFQ